MAREFTVVKGFIVARGFIPDGCEAAPKPANEICLKKCIHPDWGCFAAIGDKSPRYKGTGYFAVNFSITLWV